MKIFPLLALLWISACSSRMALPSTKNYALSLPSAIKETPPPQPKAPAVVKPDPPALEPAIPPAQPAPKPFIPVPAPREERPFVITVVVTNIISANNISAPAPSRAQKFSPQGIIYAARAGDLESVRGYLAMGVNPDTRDRLNYGATALIAATGAGHTKVVRELLLSGADVRVTASVNGVRGITALMVAAQGGPLPIAELLIGAGAEVGAITIGQGAGSTALMAAAAAGQNDILRLLINQGADINAKNITGRTALMMAAQKGNKEGVKILMDTPGIRVEDKDNSGFTALHFARQARQRDAERILMGYRLPVPLVP